MPHPSLALLVPVIGVPAAFIYLGVRKAIRQAPAHEAAPPEANSPEMKANEQKFTTPGPRGEHVFTPDAARGMLGALPGLTYSHPYPGDGSHVQIHPHPHGLPPAPGLSAWDWVKSQNRNRSVMAPLYLPTPTGTSKYLRTVPPGHEASLAKQGYGVLMYANTIGRRVPGPPTGVPPAVPRKSAPVPTPVSNAFAELPSDLHAGFNKILRGVIDPFKGQKLSNDLAQAGLPNAAAVVAANARNVAQQAALGLTTPGPSPGPNWTFNALTNQWYPPVLPPGTTPTLGPTQVPERPVPALHPHGLVHPFESHAEPSRGGVPVTKTPAGWAMPVKAVQQKLIALNWMDAINATTGKPNDDGVRGRTTDITVRAFQSAHNLPTTGVVNEATVQMLSIATPKQSSSSMVSGADEFGPTLVPPGWAIDVRSAQKMLVKLNMLGFFQVTGVADHPTRTAVLSFQASSGLPATGVADDPTAIALRHATGVSIGRAIRPDWSRVRAVIPARNVTGGPPFLPRMNIPMEGVYGPSGMNRYAGIWGHSKWP